MGKEEHEAYRLELMLKKNTRKSAQAGFLTLSRAEQRTPGRNEGEPGINNSEWSRSNCDKNAPTFHLLPLINSPKEMEFRQAFYLSNRESCNLSHQQIPIQEYYHCQLRSAISISLPTYHHFGSICYLYPKNQTAKKDGKVNGWIARLYNVYNRSNAASIMFEQNRKQAERANRRISIFWNIVHRVWLTTSDFNPNNRRMKNITYRCPIISSCFFLPSCTKSGAKWIVETAEPELVIDASIDWIKEQQRPWAEDQTFYYNGILQCHISNSFRSRYEL